MCLSVPNASPGTTATCAFARSCSANCIGVRMPFFLQSAADIRIGVECALGNGDLDSRDLAQPLDDKVAATCILGEHDSDGLLRSAHSFDGCLLRDRGRVRCAVALEFVDRRHDGRGSEAEADAPSGHRVCLRKRARNQHGVFRALGSEQSSTARRHKQTGNSTRPSSARCRDFEVNCEDAARTLRDRARRRSDSTAS